jgi:hypothetical protein
MEFIETSIFPCIVYEYFTEEEYREFQEHLNEHPDSGSIIRKMVVFEKFDGLRRLAKGKVVVQGLSTIFIPVKMKSCFSLFIGRAK